MQTQTTTGLKVKSVVDVLTSNLDCTQKTLCSLIGVTPTGLSLIIKEPLMEVRMDKIGKRLISLLYVVETLKADETLTPTLIYKVLITPSYSLADGSFLDVVGAIHGGNERDEFLVDVAEAALKMLRSKYKKKPIESGLYKAVLKEQRQANR